MIDLLSQFGRLWAGYFGFALIQNMLFLGLVALSLSLLRKAPANVKYGICCIGLVKLLLPPLIPAWFLTHSAASSSWISGVIVTVPAGAAASGADEAIALAAHSTRLGLPGLMFALWVAGVALYLTSALVSSLRLMAALRHASPVDGDPWIEAQHRGQIRICKTGRIPMPLSFGIFPRRVYVPEAWDRWSDRCRRMVISHELAHIRRWDGMVQFLQIVVGAVYFLNPLVWWLNRRMNQYREMACDDAVVSGSTPIALEYSNYLVQMAESVVGRVGILGSASALLRCRNGLLRRIHYQMREGTMHNISPSRRRLIVFGLFAVVLPLSWYCGGTKSEQDLRPTSYAALEKYKGRQIVQITVKGDGKIEIDGESVPSEQLGQKLEDITGADRERTVIFLSSEGDVRMDIIRKIHETLVAMDLRKIVYDKEALAFDDLSLILPSEDDQKRLEQIPEEHIAVLELRHGSQVLLDGESIGFWDIAEAIRARISEDPYLIVVVRSFGTSVFGDFGTVLALLKKGGATRISIDIARTIE